MDVASVARRAGLSGLSLLPTGTPLPARVWASRHRVLVLIIWLHAAAIGVYGLVASATPLHVLGESAILAMFAALASSRRLGRETRSVVAVLGVLTCSALLVHLSGGLIEMHFHFFVMVALVTLYQRWTPFLIAVGFVVLHHGVLGVLMPGAVYNHPAAQEEPWLWAGIHGVFILGASLAGLTNWKLDESMRAQAVQSEREVARESEARLAAEREVSLRRALEHELRRRADYDLLTGLPNRGHFMQKLRGAHARADRTTSLAVLFLDLDRFKVVNDSLGHRAGDMLIRDVGERLARSIRPGDTAARLGGDELTVLLDDIPNEAAAVTMAERIVSLMTEPFSIDGHEVATGVSIGVATQAPDDRTLTPDELVRRADVALYQAKGNGRGQVAVYDQGTDAMTPERVEREAALHHAIERGELHLFYQPIVRLADSSVWGFEVLTRWQHARHGMMLPELFIPAAEETGLIVPLGRWVLREACRQLDVWRASERWGGGLPLEHVHLAVNVSALELRQPDYGAFVLATLREFDVPTYALTLEITESALIDDSTLTHQVIGGLQRHGVQLAVDDFGTGYSSLSYLQRFPANMLKIDRSFVSRSDRDESSVMIVRTVTAVGQALGMRVAAEGIESEREMALLRDLGCDLGQGMLFGPPMSVEELERELAAGRLRPSRIQSVNGRSEAPVPELVYAD